MGRYGAEVGRDEMSHWPPLTMSRLQATKAVRKTTRKPKTARVARTRAGGEWSEATLLTDDKKRGKLKRLKTSTAQTLKGERNVSRPRPTKPTI